jgi:ComF family protein
VKTAISSFFSPLLHLFYPHICIGCGTDILGEDHPVCLKCLSELPNTDFAYMEGNPMEKLFWGRLKLHACTSQFYFTKGNVIQSLVHELKYKNNKQVGVYLGRMLGKSILDNDRFRNIDILVPLPLFADKERRRGYNQSFLICEGISEIINLPVMTGNILRERPTESQTLKKRKERWENVEGSFTIKDPDSLINKHILLVDDVITTGATLEACGSEILKIPGSTLSIATLTYATH